MLVQDGANIDRFLCAKPENCNTDPMEICHKIIKKSSVSQVMTVYLETGTTEIIELSIS